MDRCLEFHFKNDEGKILGTIGWPDKARVSRYFQKELFDVEIGDALVRAVSFDCPGPAFTLADIAAVGYGDEWVAREEFSVCIAAFMDTEEAKKDFTLAHCQTEAEETALLQAHQETMESAQLAQGIFAEIDAVKRSALAATTPKAAPPPAPRG